MCDVLVTPSLCSFAELGISGFAGAAPSGSTSRQLTFKSSISFDDNIQYHHRSPARRDLLTASINPPSSESITQADLFAFVILCLVLRE